MAEEVLLAVEDHQSVCFLKITPLLSRKLDKLKNPLLLKYQHKIVMIMVSFKKLKELKISLKRLNKTLSQDQNQLLMKKQ